MGCYAIDAHFTPIPHRCNPCTPAIPVPLRWAYVGYLVCFFTFFVTCAYAGLALVKHQKR
jgi:hypothetical protein